MSRRDSRERPNAGALGVLFRCLWPLRFAELDPRARRSHRSGWPDHAALQQGQRENKRGQRHALARNRSCAMKQLSVWTLHPRFSEAKEVRRISEAQPYGTYETSFVTCVFDCFSRGTGLGALPNLLVVFDSVLVVRAEQ